MGGFFSKPLPIAPIKKDEPGVQLDKRKRNSLASSVTEWVHADYGKDASKLEALMGRRVTISNLGAEPNDLRGRRAAKITQSIALGNMKTLREQVIAHFPQINKKYENWGNDSLLHIVCREGYLPMVEFIVDPKSTVEHDTTVIEYNAENEKRRTPLHVAFTSPQDTFCGKNFGVDEHGLPRTKRPGDLALSEKDWIKPGTEDDRQKIVNILVDKGADIHRLDYHDYSPLHLACIWGWKRTAALLLQRGANPEIMTVVGKNALMAAAEFKHEDILELLIDTTHVPLEAKDVQGETALLYAISAGHVASVEILCQFGANPDVTSYTKDTALKRACRANNADIVNILFDFRVGLDETALNLLHGDAKENIMSRLLAEKEEKRRQFEATQIINVTRCKETGVRGRPPGPSSDIGQWVPYRDKLGKGVFFYNKVSRISQFDVPVDYKKDPHYVVRDATYGMHFYH